MTDDWGRPVQNPFQLQHVQHLKSTREFHETGSCVVMATPSGLQVRRMPGLRCPRPTAPIAERPVPDAEFGTPEGLLAGGLHCRAKAAKQVLVTGTAVSRAAGHMPGPAQCACDACTDSICGTLCRWQQLTASACRVEHPGTCLMLGVQTPGTA